MERFDSGCNLVIKITAEKLKNSEATRENKCDACNKFTLLKDGRLLRGYKILYKIEINAFTITLCRRCKDRLMSKLTWG